jgi:peptide/nickel transport system permease protein
MRLVRHFFARWQNWLGLFMVLFFVLMAFAAPLLSPMDPKDHGLFKKVGHTRAERLDIAPHPPSDIAPLGTLPYQYSVYHTIVWGSRDALQFGLTIVLIAGIFGVVWGAAAGFSGGAVNTVMMRVADAFLAFPVIAAVVFLQQLLAIAVEAAGGMYLFGLGPQVSQYFGSGRQIDIVGDPAPIQILLSFVNPLILSLILFMWMPYARLVNSMVISLKNTEFIHASRALGSSSTRTVFRHIIPNSISPAVVLMARDVGGVVILQATLTFIGLGGESPWGDILSQGRSFIINAGGLLHYWWVYIPATAAVMLFAIAWNLLGDGLNDVLDPTAHYDFHRPPFWTRLLRKRGKHALPEPEQPVPAVDVPMQATPSARTWETEPAQTHKFRYSDGTDPLLLAARANVSNGNLIGALHAYQHLIQRNRMVKEILPDLAQLVQAHPRDPLIWQTLGDALAQEGDMVHARQSYDQARKLKQ